MSFLRFFPVSIAVVPEVLAAAAPGAGAEGPSAAARCSEAGGGGRCEVAGGYSGYDYHYPPYLG